MIDKTGQASPHQLMHLDAYEPSRLAKNDVKNSSSPLQRVFAFFFTIGLHVFFFWWLIGELDFTKKFLPDEVLTVLEFLEPEPKLMPVEIMPDMPITATRIPIISKNGLPANTHDKPVPDGRQIEKKNIETTLTLYDEVGRIRLPVDFIEKFDEKNAPGKRFDFRNPNLELAGTFLKRPPPAIEFNPTQFEDAWKPDQDILTELLEKAVEKTTKEIKIPVPGNPGVKLVCKVSILAAGGGCGFVPNGGYGRVIPDDEDDPDTLSPEEDRQCQAWWEKISNTRSQREWLKTKELYELTCKKPLAKEKIKAP